jgi:hypothetical protein
MVYYVLGGSKAVTVSMADYSVSFKSSGLIIWDNGD